MKKTLLSLAFIASALFASAQNPGLSSTAVFDDYMTTEPYSIPTTEIGFDEVLKIAKTETAVKGIFPWTDDASNTVDYTWVRNGDGKLTYTITKPYGSYDPIGIGFGSYAASATATTPSLFTIDLSNNATLEITISKKDTAKIKVLFQLVDINKKALYIDKKVATDATNPWKYQLGYNDNAVYNGEVVGAKPTFSADDTPVTLTYDFKNALPGSYPNFDADNSTFDYSKVTSLQIFVTNAHENSADGSKPYPLNNSILEITSFKLGDVSTIVAGLEDNFLFANANEVVSVYDMMGKFVASGKLNTLGLESGKLYVVKSGNKTRKIVMN